MVDGVIFDLDGTLWDARNILVKAWNYTLNKMGIDIVIDVEKLTPCLGLPLSDIADRLFPDFDREKKDNIIEVCCNEQLGFLRQYGGILYDGLEETLAELKKSYKLMIVSNCRCGYIESFLEAHKLEDMFSDHEDNGRTGLLKAENIELVIERNNLKSAVYVGDTAMDGAACKKAGVPFIFAAYGFGDCGEYAARIESFKQLPEVVSKM